MAAECRLCLRSDAIYDLCDAFGRFNKLKEIIEELFALNIQTPMLPTMVCASCARYIDEYYTFYLQVKQNQNTLLARLQGQMNNFVYCIPSQNQFYIVQNPQTVFVQQPINPPIIGNICLPPTTNIITQPEYIYNGAANVMVDSNVTANLEAPDVELQKEAIEIEMIDEEDLTDIDSHDGLIIDENSIEDTNTSQITDSPNRLVIDESFIEEANHSINVVNKIREYEIVNHNERFVQVVERLKSDGSINDIHYKKLTERPLQIVDDCGHSLLDSELVEILSSRYFELKCELCQIVDEFKLVKELYSHYQLFHRVRGYIKCCNLRLYTRKKIVLHLALHLQVSLFQCRTCKKEFKNFISLKNHRLNHLPESEKPHKCDHCERRFATRTALNTHKISHIPKDSHITDVCKLCGKGFLNRICLYKHKITSHSMKTYTCDYCDKDYSTRAGIKAHLTTHTDKKIACKQCGFICASKRYLLQHMKLHEKKQFHCTICDYRSRRKSSLKFHMTSKHSDNYPFMCDYCNKEFKLKGNLQTHIYRHIGVRNFKCEFCSSSFMTYGNRHIHMSRLHSREFEKNREKRRKQKFVPLKKINNKKKT